MRILVIEDEPKVPGLIKRGQDAEGLAADVAINGEDAPWMAAATEYDVIVLDVMRRGIDGFETCRSLRADGVWAPFMRRPGEVLTRFHLLEHAWDYDYENRSNPIDIFVRYLRKENRPPIRRAHDRNRPRYGLTPPSRRHLNQLWMLQTLHPPKPIARG